MLLNSLVVLASVTCGLARSVPYRVPRQEPSTTASAADTQSTICGDIINAVNNEGKSRASGVAYRVRGSRELAIVTMGSFFFFLP